MIYLCMFRLILGEFIFNFFASSRHLFIVFGPLGEASHWVFFFFYAYLFYLQIFSILFFSDFFKDVFGDKLVTNVIPFLLFFMVILAAFISLTPMSRLIPQKIEDRGVEFLEIVGEGW